MTFCSRVTIHVDLVTLTLNLIAVYGSILLPRDAMHSVTCRLVVSVCLSVHPSRSCTVPE